MIRFVLLCTSLLILSIHSFAVTDSVSLGINKDKVVYYSLKNGLVSTIQNNDWHLAFSAQPALFPSNTLQSASVRINEAYGVHVFKVPNKGIADFATVDTSGWNNWSQIHDSDTLLWMGAFNRNVKPTDVYNYGWGEYNFGAHSVLGDSLFLIQLPNGTLKKFAILKNEWDTAFVVKFANIDNSSTNTVTIPKKPYRTKNFVYYDLTAGTIKDREPASSTWDIQYSLYTDPNGKRKIGALINTRCTAENNWIIPCYQSEKYNVSYNAMGEFGMGNDTLAETITDQNIHIQTADGNYNMNFGPNNPSTNTFVYTAVACGNALGIEENNALQAKLYPNPASNIAQLEVNDFAGKAIQITDLTGQLVFATALNATVTSINCNQFAEGVYCLHIIGNGANEVKRFVVSK